MISSSDGTTPSRRLVLFGTIRMDGVPLYTETRPSTRKHFPTTAGLVLQPFDGSTIVPEAVAVTIHTDSTISVASLIAIGVRVNSGRRQISSRVGVVKRANLGLERQIKKTGAGLVGSEVEIPGTIGGVYSTTSLLAC